MVTTSGHPDFINYPVPKQGPNVPYRKKRKSNPIIRGRLVSISAFLMEKVSFIPQLAWINSGFGAMRTIRDYIQTCESRFDPTVIPLGKPLAEENQMLDPQTLNTTILWQKNPDNKYYSAEDYHSMYKSGELTPLAVVKAILPLIRRDITPPGEYSIGLFDTNVDLVLKTAEESTKRYQKKSPLGIFDGVPTGIKDEFDLDGYKTSHGSPVDFTGIGITEGSITAWNARKLQEAGAIIMGKLSMHEFGLDTTGTNILYGTPTNPHNTGYYTGGSSSGCAYAVSAGLIPMALGSDGGGSIRIPSSFCGIFGLKPSHGRLSHYPAVNHASTVSVNGPMAADIRTLCAIYHVVGIPGPHSQFPPPSPYPLSLPAPRSKVLGFPKMWIKEAQPAVRDLFQALLDNLMQQYGYTLLPIEIPFLPEGQMAHALTILSDGAALLPNASKFSPANRILLTLGRQTPCGDYVLAQKLRQLLMSHLSYLWQQNPGMLIVTPTTACAGWPIESKSELKYGLSNGDRTMAAMEYVWLANFTGVPSLTVPAGFADKNVPVGMMAVAEWGGEADLLRWGLDAEEANVERFKRPERWVDVFAMAKKEMDES